MELLVAIGILILFDVLALLFGADSRDRRTVGGYLRPFERERASRRPARSEPTPVVEPGKPARSAVALRPDRVSVHKA